MTNLECAVAVLASHREGRKWHDPAVAADLLAQLGVDPEGEASNAVTRADPLLVSELEVLAAEAAAKDATEKAKGLRDQLLAQEQADATARAFTAADQAKAAKQMREAAGKAALEPTPAQDAGSESAKAGA